MDSMKKMITLKSSPTRMAYLAAAGGFILATPLSVILPVFAFLSVLYAFVCFAYLRDRPVPVLQDLEAGETVPVVAEPQYVAVIETLYVFYAVAALLALALPFSHIACPLVSLSAFATTLAMVKTRGS